MQLDFVWFVNNCTGEYVYEHWNEESTSDNDVVRNGSFHFWIPAVGFITCWEASLLEKMQQHGAVSILLLCSEW